MKSRTLLAAGIIRDIEFDSKTSMELYFYKLQHNCVVYKIMDSCTRSNGAIIVRVLQQYASADLIEL